VLFIRVVIFCIRAAPKPDESIGMIDVVFEEVLDMGIKRRMLKGGRIHKNGITNSILDFEVKSIPLAVAETKKTVIFIRHGCSA